MNNVQKAALVYLLAMVVFFYGYAVSRFKVFPHAYLESAVKEIEAFVAGDAHEKSSVIEKLQNDAGFAPLRFTYGVHEDLYANHVPLETPGLKDRRDRPLVFIDEAHTEGYRVIVGSMDFEEAFWGALLIGPGGDVIHRWTLSTEHLPQNKDPDLLKVLYGVHVGSDGSMTFSMQESAGGIVKVDACSNEIWNLPGEFHHTVSSDGEGAYWSFVGSQYTLDQDMVKISAETGEILHRIDMTEVRAANPHIHIWDLTLPVYDPKPERRYRTGNLTHGNDIDPLGQDVAASFEQFEVGDLLVSYATTNLVFILDPDTLKVKWWRIGLSDYHHDPDWESDGRITIYSNERRREENFSRIVYIDPVTFEDGVTFDGAAIRFRSPANGMHQRTGYNTRMITSANQGWAFEVDDAGETVFSFINSYSRDDNKTLFISDALRLMPEYFDGKPWEACTDNN